MNTYIFSNQEESFLEFYQDAYKEKNRYFFVLPAGILNFILFSTFKLFDKDFAGFKNEIDSIDQVILQGCNSFEGMLRQAIKYKQKILINLKSGKIYVVKVREIVNPANPQNALTVYPVKSGYRCSQTKKAIFNINYEEYQEATFKEKGQKLKNKYSELLNDKKVQEIESNLILLFHKEILKKLKPEIVRNFLAYLNFPIENRINISDHLSINNPQSLAELPKFLKYLNGFFSEKPLRLSDEQVKVAKIISEELKKILEEQPTNEIVKTIFLSEIVSISYYDDKIDFSSSMDSFESKKNIKNLFYRRHARKRKNDFQFP